MSKKNQTKQLTIRKGKTPYFIGAGLALIMVGLLVFASGYWQSSNNISTYFGILDSSASDKEKEEHIQTFIAQNQGISDACEILYFNSQQCGACKRLEPWLTDFKTKYPDIQIRSHELPGSRPLFNAKQREYGVSSLSIPAIFICGSVVVGVEPIQTAFKSMALAVYDLEPHENEQIPMYIPLELTPA